MKRWLNTLLIIVFAGIFTVSAVYLGSYFLSSRQQQNRYDDLAALVEQTVPASAADSAIPAETAVEQTSPLVEILNPKTGENTRVLRQYARLYEMNSDLVGWLKIEGTKINYPVMQTPDRPDYYLKRNFDRQSSEHGCLYAREVCSIEPSSDNITIYGHHMRDGSMFGALSRYQDKAFWQEHRTLHFDTLTQQYTYEILAVFLTTASQDRGFSYHLFCDAYDEAQYNEFVSTCKALSLYDTGVDARWGDKLITLSTCDYSQVNGRLVVVAKRLS